MVRAIENGLSEEVVARLARAAYLVALKHGVRGPFIDVELELWRVLRQAAWAEPAPETDAEAVA